MKKALVSFLLIPICFACFFLNLDVSANVKEIDIKEAHDYLGKPERYIEVMKGKPDTVKEDEEHLEYSWLYGSNPLKEMIIYDAETKLVNSYYGGFIYDTLREALEQFKHLVDMVDEFNDVDKLGSDIDYENIGDEDKIWASAVWEIEDTDKIIVVAARDLYVYINIFYSQKIEES